MTYRPVPFHDFGAGLNLRDGPDVVSERECIDCMNVVFTERGAVKQRDGFDNLTTGEGTNRYDSLGAYYTASGTKQLMAGAGNRLDVITTAGAVSTSSTAPTANPHYFARFGSPTAEYLYIANGTDQIRRWDGSAFSTPAGLAAQTGRFLTVQPTDNRLVHARTATNTSRVAFSNAGAAETYSANDWVDIRPGDGEAIMGVCAWREFVFVFKETSFAVFYGNSTDSTGNSVFNYRLVDAGIGLASSRALAVGRDGVYFMSRKGIYRTTGREPELMSGIVEPIFTGAIPTTYSTAGGVALAHSAITSCAMTWHDERIYLAFPSSSANNRVLVNDPRYGWWSIFDIPAAAMCTFRPSSQDELVFAYSSGLKHIGRYSSAYVNDDGAAISSRWQSGWFDYKAPYEKTIRETNIWGTGKITLSNSRDYQDATSQSTVTFAVSDTWGDGTGTDTWGDGTGTDTWGSGGGSSSHAMARKALRGTVFSTKFSNTILNQAWSVHRLSHHLRESRRPTVHTSS